MAVPTRAEVLATDRVDGFVVDRGFPVLNTGCPRAADLDVSALDLGWFDRGAIVRVCGRAHRVVAPRSRSTALPGTVAAPLVLRRPVTSGTGSPWAGTTGTPRPSRARWPAAPGPPGPWLRALRPSAHPTPRGA